MSILQVEKVTVGYGDTTILTDVSITVKENEIVTIVGPNGAGKSTLLKTIVGLLHPWEGQIMFQDKNINKIPAEKMKNIGLAYVPQVENVFPTLTIKENLMMMFSRGESKRNVNDGVEYIMNLFPQLKPKLTSKATVLSGGERQMLAMGRALITKPSMVILDEPTAALSPKLRKQVFSKIVEISENNIPVLMVEQNVREALEITDYGFVFDVGKNALNGTGRELLDDERLGALYLGEKIEI